MSGIVGIFHLDGRPVEPEPLKQMTEAIAHRGPDGEGRWVESAMGLGHRMLWTTPESLHERLPLANRTGTLVLTADARIDNRDELMAALGVSPKGEVTDSELILGAYEKWGERCPERLLGDFAFVVWDRQRQVFFCARDHFGVKPFYYHHSGRVFVFASEIKALLCLPEVPRRLNETKVADFLVPMLEDSVVTFYRDILRLPPAHFMIVGREGIRLQSHWALDPTREVHCTSDAEYTGTFRELFTEAVRVRLRSAYPVGSMLSGGLDSSSVVCVARRLLSQDGDRRLRTFSAVFDDVPECDERPFIDAVVAQGEIDPHYVHADRLSPLADVERVLWHQDEPFDAPNLFLHWGLYGAAQECGARVLLDGFDGDTVVSYGVQRLAELFRRGRWVALAGETRRLSRNLNRSPWRILLFRAIGPWIPGFVWQAWHVVRGRRRPGSDLDPVVNPGFARRVGLVDRARALQKSWSGSMRTAREHHYRGLTSDLIPLTLEVTDKAAAAFSIEPRYPFLSKQLAEFCLALPSEQKLREGWTRVVMRRALAGILPTEVQWRGGKSDLSPNFVRGLLAFEQDRLDEVILARSGTIQEYVDVAALREAYHRYASQATQEDALTVWKVVALALWLRQTGLSV